MPQKQQQVVVGIDGSEPAVRALRWALGYAEQTGARIEAVHAWQIPAMYGTAVAAVPSGEFRSAAERVLRETVDEALGEHGGLDVERVTEMGHPSKVLVEHSEGADLLVVGSRGRGGLVGTLIGSVSLHCVTRAACPVVVVRAED